MPQPAHHHDAFARTRMLRVLDQNVKGLFLGSMSPSRTTPASWTAYSRPSEMVSRFPALETF